MPNTFPTLSSGSMTVATSIANEPLGRGTFVRSNRFVTRVARFLDDSEQRWVVHPGLMSAVLNLQGMNGYDTSQLATFFRARKGAYLDAALTNTFSITIQGTQYDYCVFDQDDFTVAESKEKPMYFDIVLRIRQVRTN